MPDTSPSNAPDDLTPRTDDSVAKQVENVGEDTTGGGGLGGAAAAEPLAGSARGKGGASPNSPIDTGVSPDGDAVRDAQVRSLDDGADEPDRVSR